MKSCDPKSLSAKLLAEVNALAKMPESEIDTSEMPPIKDWSKGERGALFRPVKRALSLRLDADIVDWFQRQGTGHQTRMNAALREYVNRHRKSA